MFKRYIGIILSICVLTGILTACGIPASLEEKFGNSKTKEETTKERVMTFYHWDTENQELYRSLAQTYMETKKGLTIEVTAVDYDSYVETWLQSVTDKKIADVFAVPAGTDLEHFSGSKKLADLTKKDMTPESYDKRLLQCGMANQKLWAVPINTNVPVVFYRQSYYDALGLALPLTSADFFMNCDILKENQINPFAFFVNEEGYFETMDFAEGIIANGYHPNTQIEDAVFDKKAETMTLELYDVAGVAHQMFSVEYFPGKESAPKEHNALLEHFAQGTYAMVPGEIGDITKIKKLLESNDFDYFLMPGAGATHTGVLKAEMMLGISKDSDLINDAEGFIKYLLSDEVQKLICEQTFTIPVIKNVQLENEMLNKMQQQLTTADESFVSFFQRITNSERQMCMEKLDIIFQNEYDGLHVFMQQWKDEL